MTVPLTFVLGVLGILIGKHFYRTGKELLVWPFILLCSLDEICERGLCWFWVFRREDVGVC